MPCSTLCVHDRLHVTDERMVNVCSAAGSVATANQRKLCLGFDIVYDNVGKDYIQANQDVLGVDSRWIVHSHLSGPEADKLSLATLLKKRITLFGTVLRARSAEYKANLIRQFEDEVVVGFSDGRLKVVIDKTWPMERIADAHKHMEENLTMGKLVVTVLGDQT